MSLSSILVPSSGCLFGVYPATSCDSAANYATRVHNHETQINRTAVTNGILNIVSSYHDFDDFTSSFPSADEATVAAEGRLLLVHWTPRIFGSSTIFKWPDITAGTYDASYVDPTARAIRDYGKKVFVAFHNEMNASSTEGGGAYGTDAQYAAAAQHIHDRFATIGASNVVWVFKPSGYTATISRLSTLYPGDAYVDWIGFDPYSTGETGGWEDLDYVATTKYPVYTWATVTKSGSHTKPLMWAEWGVQENGGVPNGGAYPNTKAGWFDQVHGAGGSGYAGIASTMPLLKAIVYFNSTAGVGRCINTSSQALDAYKELAKDGYFRPDMSTTPPPPPGVGAFRASSAANFSNTTSKAVTIPAASQAGDSAVLFHTCTRAELRNAAEGTNAANVTTGNSNSVGSNPWDAIAGTAPTYDTTSPLDGASSMKAAVSATSTSGARWSTSFSWTSTYKGRLLYDYPSNPSAICRIYQQASSAGTNQWGVGIDTNGKLIVRDLAAGATRGTSTATPATSTKHRVEWEAAWDSVAATTVVTLRLYLGTNWNGSTPDETVTSTAFSQAAAPGQGTFGVHFSAANTYSVRLDQMALDQSYWPSKINSSAVLTDPAGWSAFTPQILGAGAAELAGRAYRKVIAAGDPGATVTLGTDVAAHGSILLLVYSGTDPTTPVEVVASSTKSSDSATVITPNVTTAVAGDWIASAAFTRDNPGGLTTSWTLPGGEAQRAATLPASSADGRVAGVASDDAAAHAAGTYGTKTFTSNVSSYLGVGWTVALKPSAATGDTQSCGLVGIP